MTRGDDSNAAALRFLDSAGVSAADRGNFRFQYDVARDYIIPLLAASGIGIAGSRVLEVGAGEAGALVAFLRAGATRGVALDVSKDRLAVAAAIASAAEVRAEFRAHDIVESPADDDLNRSFDMVIMRDSIEHMEDPASALRHVAAALAPGGVVYVSFPPWYSPFGGHQQTLSNRYSLVPYLHLLPAGLFDRALVGGREPDVEEVRRLRRRKLTIARVRRFILAAGYTTIREDLYLIRPVFESRYGLSPLRLNLLRRLPLLREFLSLEAQYILRRSTGPHPLPSDSPGAALP